MANEDTFIELIKKDIEKAIEFFPTSSPIALEAPKYGDIVVTWLLVFTFA